MDKYKMKTVATAAIAVMMLATMLSAAEFTITLNQNYAGAPANTTRATDDYGCLMGEPLPTPTRTGQVFNGWFTASTGGSRVLVGATGTKFTQNTMIYARWSAAASVIISSIPAAMKENFDWLRYTRHVREPVLFSRQNLIFDQIWRGNGSINYAVRWESDRAVTLAERQAIALMLHEEINKWTRPLIGMQGWPYQEIPVTVIGWAVSDSSIIRDIQPNETIWVNNDHREPKGIQHESLMASAPDNISRFVNFARVNAGTYNYPGGLHARFDMYLWATKGFGGGAGGDWGARLSETTSISAANGGNTTIITHETGHGFGLYDFYGAVGTDRPPATTVSDATGNKNFNAGELRTVMVAGGGAPSGTLGSYDQWQIRYYWDWVKAESPDSRFVTFSSSSSMPSSSSRTRSSSSAAVSSSSSNGTTNISVFAPSVQFFNLNNRGIFSYNLGEAKSANLKIFDSNGKLLKAIPLNGTHGTIDTQLGSSMRVLLWRVEDNGRLISQSKSFVVRW